MNRAIPLLVFVLLLLGATSGMAAPGANDTAPKGSVGSGAITLEDLEKSLQTKQTRKYGIVINYVLPKGWEVVEKSKEGKQSNSGSGAYVLLSRRPMPEPKEPTDFIFELDVFEEGLTAKLPKTASLEEHRDEAFKRLWEFLDTQMSVNLRLGFKCKTQRKDIEPKEYGPETRGKKTTFVPVFYEIPADPKDKKSKGAMLYTFTSFEGDKIWMLKFLVSKDMVDQHGALIALILNNSYALTEEADKRLREAAQKADSKVKGN